MMKEVQIENLAYQWSNPAGKWVVPKEKRKPRRIHLCINHFDGAAIERSAALALIFLSGKPAIRQENPGQENKELFG